MTSDIDLCNMALAHLGCEPDVDDLEPPNNPNAQLCATFLDQARNSVLTAQPWVFAGKRVVLEYVAVSVSSFDAATNLVTTATAHGLAVNNPVEVENLSTGGSYPSPLEASTTYYVQAVASTTTFRLSEEEDGDAIDLTTAGSGTFVIRKLSDRSDKLFAYAEPTDIVMVGPHAVVPEGWDPHNLGNLLPIASCWQHAWSHIENWQWPDVPFERALNRAGERVIYCDLEDAEMLYTASVDDLTTWPPDAIECLWLKLAMILAGPIKRDDGKTARAIAPVYEYALSRAASNNAVQVQRNHRARYPWNR